MRNPLILSLLPGILGVMNLDYIIQNEDHNLFETTCVINNINNE
jgi:hypothetical protein